MQPRAGWLAAAIGFTVLAAACSPAGRAETTTSVAITAGSTPPTTAATAVLPPEPPPIVPMLRTSDAGDLVIGQQLGLISQVLAAEPISRLELWADGALVASHGFAEPVTDPSFPWEWTAESVGLHAIEVRAFDVSGRVAGSSPSWLRVGADIAPSVGAAVRQGFPESPLGKASAGVVADAASCIATVSVPAAPGSVGQVVRGTTLGFGRTQAIAVLGPDGSDITVPMTSTPVLLSVEPYDDSLSAPGLTMIIPGAAGCSFGDWDGAIQFDGTTLPNTDGLDAAYLYVKEDVGDWQRIPETGFVPAGPNGFDFAGLLPAVRTGGQLGVEAWGWSNGQLIDLGRGSYSVRAHSGPTEPVWGSVQPVTPFSSLNIVRRLASVDSGNSLDEFLHTTDVLCVGAIIHPGCGPEPATLRWNANLLGAEAGLIQVSSTHPPAGAATDFPGLIWSTMIAMDGAAVRDFDLDLTQIYAGTAPSGEERLGRLPVGGSGWLEYADLEAMGAVLSVVATPAPPGAKPRTSPPAVGRWWQDSPPSRLWVRVVPFVNAMPTDGVSNPVLFEIDSEEITFDPNAKQPFEADFDAAYDVAVEFHHPLVSNEAYSHCVRVTSNPFGGNNPAAVPQLQFVYDALRDSARSFAEPGAPHRGLVPGATVCAYKPDPPDKDVFDYVAEAISFVAEAWDTFKDLVDMVKSGIIQGIVDITGCKPEATCVAALNALADAGLAAIGVPPTMPSFNELIEAAKGDIAAALTKALVGQVCDGACADFAEGFINDAIDDIEEHFSDLATAQARSGGWVLKLNPDIRVIPEPAGQLFPGSVAVRITRKVDGAIGPNVPQQCNVGLLTTGSGPLTWSAKSGDAHVDEEVAGPVFAKEHVLVDLTKLDPGESVTVGLSSLDFDRTLYLSGTGPGLGGYASQEKLLSTALWTDPDVKFQMSASVCSKGFGESVSKRIAMSPGDIPTP